MTGRGQEQGSGGRFVFLDNLRTAMIFFVVLNHAGVVYEASGIFDTIWLVDDPATNNVAGLLNLIIDIFAMPVIFFVSGFLAPVSLTRRPGWSFLAHRFRRLMVPWLLAVLTLIPLYKVIFLMSRGLPPEHWTAYFPFGNGVISQSWLWFLPVLFLFDAVFWGLAKAGVRPPRVSLPAGVAIVFVAGVLYSLTVNLLGWSGWTKTPLIDFQNERLLVYFLVFLLGSLSHRLGVFDSPPAGSRKLYITLAATLWIPMNVYLIVLLNLIFRPGVYFVSLPVDLFVMNSTWHLSMLGMLYLLVSTFRFWVDRDGPVRRVLNANAYSVYIVHMGVLGVIAMLLLHTGMASVAKYLILALSTYVVTNVLVYGYTGLLKPRLAG